MKRHTLITLSILLLTSCLLYAAYAPEVGVGDIWFCGEFEKPCDPDYGKPLAGVVRPTGSETRAVKELVYGDVEGLPDELELHFHLDNNGGKLAHQVTLRITYDLLVGSELPKKWKMKDFDLVRAEAKWKNIFVRHTLDRGLAPYETKEFVVSGLDIKEQRERCFKHGNYIWSIRVQVEILNEDWKLANNIRVHQVDVSVD